MSHAVLCDNVCVVLCPGWQNASANVGFEACLMPAQAIQLHLQTLLVVVAGSNILLSVITVIR